MYVILKCISIYWVMSLLPTGSRPGNPLVAPDRRAPCRSTGRPMRAVRNKAELIERYHVQKYLIHIILNFILIYWLKWLRKPAIRTGNWLDSLVQREQRGSTCRPTVPVPKRTDWITSNLAACTTMLNTHYFAFCYNLLVDIAAHPGNLVWKSTSCTRPASTVQINRQTHACCAQKS